MQSTEGASLKTTPSVGKKNVSTSGNGTFSLSNSFVALNDENLIIEELLDGKCVLVDDNGKPLEKVEYSGDNGSEDEVEYVHDEMASYLTSKSSGVGYGTKSLLEQWRKTYVNDDYDPYDDDMYEGEEISDNIQSICDNLDIEVLG
ncbi:hypothetical protein Tco_0627683 [Tanacetum coccineum]|uniref:Uncharacterized protein n=1 Tax=Tanacetum coccineum TaxID=301880 RepID=A0ABQ4WN54_9ASTR